DGSYGSEETRVIRVDWARFSDAPALMPGAGGNVPPAVVMGPVVDVEFARETPRKSLDERVEEEISRAILWLKEMVPFDSALLRRGIGVRDSVAVALIDAMAANGLIEKDGDGLWMPTGKGFRLTATANAAEAVAAWRAGKAVAS